MEKMPGSGVKQRLLKLNNNLVYPHSNTCTWLHIHFYRKGKRSSSVRKFSLLNFFINLIIKPHFCISLTHKRNKITISILKVRTSNPSLQIHSLIGHWFASFRWNSHAHWHTLVLSLEQSEMICIFAVYMKTNFVCKRLSFDIPICTSV